MTGSALQRRHDVFLVADRRYHDNAGFRMLAHDLLGRLDPFHLRHGDVHEHNIGIDALVFGNGSHAVAGFTCHLAAKGFYNAGQILAGEDRIVDHQIAHRLTVLGSF